MANSFPMLSAYQPPPAVPGRDLHRQSTNSPTRSDVENASQQDWQPPTLPEERQARRVSRTHRRLVFTDPVAFRYLEEDESTTVLARRSRLEGYELYVVEQWACSRTHPTFTVCTHTSDSSHSILVNVLAVPDDQSLWSKRLKIYLDAISQSYAREKETHLGLIMVTNLSGFPSALNVIAVPDGDVKKHREDFIVNENLKRMGCAGRAAMSLQYPQLSTISKFQHMYRTSHKVPLYPSVMEIVRFCQIALVLFGKLQPAYADGLLCDITERAISEWWNEIGIDFHNVEPSDGILGPTTVSALIGLMIGAYNRLKETGAPVGKDPINLSSMKKAVEHFQKANKMERSRRLDRATLDRLHRVTARNAEDEGLGVTRALKSTVAGLSGKGGEMIARGLGGGKEKAGIAEVETLDIERLSQLVVGRSMKWLWQGKELKSASATTAGPPDELNGKVFSTDDQGNFIWTGEAREGPDQLDGLLNAPEHEGREKRSSRFKDAVGLSSSKGHHGQGHHTDEETAVSEHLMVPSISKDSKDHSLSREVTQSNDRAMPPLDLALADAPATSSKLDVVAEGLPRMNGDLTSHRQALRGLDHKGRESPGQRRVREELSNIRESLQARRYQSFSAGINYQQPQAKILRRSLSAIQLRGITEARVSRLPRQLSFSLVSESMELQMDKSSASDTEGEAVGKPATLVKIRKEQLRKSQQLANKIYSLDRGLRPFSTSRVEKVEHLKRSSQGVLEELNNVYYQHLEEYQTLQATSTDLVAREKSSLNEGMRSIEMLGQKLDYELDSLQSRMQEVEESVDDFERRVMDIEASVRTLLAERQKEEIKRPGWWERLTGGRVTGRAS